jgi:hypothetical protein
VNADMAARISQLVHQRVQLEVSQHMDTIVRRCAKEFQQQQQQQQQSTKQAVGLSSSLTGSSSAGAGASGGGPLAGGIFARSAGVEQFTSLEKEVIRLSGDLERTRSRLTALDTAYTELKASTTAREVRAEESHKKAIHAQRVEVESFLSAAARKTTETLAAASSGIEAAAQIRSDLDQFIERSGTALAELDLRLAQHDESKEEVYSVLERVETEQHHAKNRQSDTERSLFGYMEESLQLAKAAGTVEDHSRQLQLLGEKLAGLEVQVQANTSCMDAQVVPIDMLAKSIDAINEKFESRTDLLRQGMEAHKAGVDKVLVDVHESGRKTRGKLRDLAESVRGVAQIRQSIEVVLKEVDARAKQDASWTYGFKAALQKIDGRLLAVEYELNPSSALLQVQEQVQGGGGAGSAGAASGAGLSPSKQSFKEGGGGGGTGGSASSPFRSAAAAAVEPQSYPTFPTGTSSTGSTGACSTGGGRGVAGIMPLAGSQFDEIRKVIAQLRTEFNANMQDELAKQSVNFMELLSNQIDRSETR